MRAAEPAADRAAAAADPAADRAAPADPTAAADPSAAAARVADDERSALAEWTAIAEHGAAAAEVTFETAARGLRNLGFRDGEVRRALALVRAKLGPSASAEAIVREALRVLT